MCPSLSVRHITVKVLITSVGTEVRCEGILALLKTWNAFNSQKQETTLIELKVA